MSCLLDFEFKGRQEDAQEFLSFLLNRLHDEMVKCLESQDSKIIDQINGDHCNGNNEGDGEEEDDEWKEVGKKNRAFVTRRVNINFLFYFLSLLFHLFIIKRLNLNNHHYLTYFVANFVQHYLKLVQEKKNLFHWNHFLHYPWIFK